jgi:hypothetical protein
MSTNYPVVTLAAFLLACTPACRGGRDHPAPKGSAAPADAAAVSPTAKPSACSTKVLMDVKCIIRTPTKLWGATCRRTVREPLTLEMTEDGGTDISDWSSTWKVVYDPVVLSIPREAAFEGRMSKQGSFKTTVTFKEHKDVKIAAVTTAFGKPEKKKSEEKKLPRSVVLFRDTLFAVGPRLLGAAGELAGLTVLDFKPVYTDAASGMVMGENWKLVREPPAQDGTFVLKLYDAAGSLQETVRFDKNGLWISEEEAGTEVTTSVDGIP